MRPSLANLVYAATLDTGLRQRVRRPLGGKDLEAALDELARKPNCAGCILQRLCPKIGVLLSKKE